MYVHVCSARLKDAQSTQIRIDRQRMESFVVQLGIAHPVDTRINTYTLLLRK